MCCWRGISCRMQYGWGSGVKRRYYGFFLFLFSVTIFMELLAVWDEQDIVNVNILNLLQIHRPSIATAQAQAITRQPQP